MRGRTNAVRGSIIAVALALGCARREPPAGEHPAPAPRAEPEPVTLTAAELEVPDDRTLERRLRAHLDAEALDDIAVEVHGGAITLRGHVSPQTREAALRAARETGRPVLDALAPLPNDR
jgi:hypothetical protein